MSRRIVHTSILLAFIAWVGCGGSDRPELVPVSGTVTFDGGECPGPGRIDFAPMEPAPGFSRRPGGGEFDVDGSYTASSFESGDGLVPGTYRVHIVCWKTPPTMDKPAGESYIPAGFTAENLVVEPDSSSVEANFDVPTR